MTPREEMQQLRACSSDVQRYLHLAAVVRGSATSAKKAAGAKRAAQISAAKRKARKQLAAGHPER